jgi:hypothetical protein
MVNLLWQNVVCGNGFSNQQQSFENSEQIDNQNCLLRYLHLGLDFLTTLEIVKVGKVILKLNKKGIYNE